MRQWHRNKNNDKEISIRTNSNRNHYQPVVIDELGVWSNQTLNICTWAFCKRCCAVATAVGVCYYCAALWKLNKVGIRTLALISIQCFSHSFGESNFQMNPHHIIILASDSRFFFVKIRNPYSFIQKSHASFFNAESNIMISFSFLSNYTLCTKRYCDKLWALRLSFLSLYLFSTFQR